MPKPGALLHLEVMGSSGPLPCGLSPAICAVQPGRGVQLVTSRGLGAAEPIPAYCGKGAGEASISLEWVKLLALQSGPEQLCCRTRAGHGGRKPEGAMLIFSQSWMTHSSPAASEIQGGHSGHQLRENFGPLAHVDPCRLHVSHLCTPLTALKLLKEFPFKRWDHRD